MDSLRCGARPPSRPSLTVTRVVSVDALRPAESAVAAE